MISRQLKRSISIKIPGKEIDVGKLDDCGAEKKKFAVNPMGKNVAQDEHSNREEEADF